MKRIINSAEDNTITLNAEVSVYCNKDWVKKTDRQSTDVEFASGNPNVPSWCDNKNDLQVYCKPLNDIKWLQSIQPLDDIIDLVYETINLLIDNNTSYKDKLSTFQVSNLEIDVQEEIGNIYINDDNTWDLSNVTVTLISTPKDLYEDINENFDTYFSKK